jgi:hypothetical protein
MVITYPVPVPALYLAMWQGAFDFAWEVTKKKGLPVKAKHDGGVLRFELAWEG